MLARKAQGVAFYQLSALRALDNVVSTDKETLDTALKALRCC